MTRRNRGADLLVRVLRDAGVRRLFTVSGNHIMSVFDAALDGGIELIHARHEAATVHMADASSRISGKVGVALVTGGPGHANALSALYTARMAEAPVLLLSGHAPTDQLGMGAFQAMRQAEMAAPVAKASWTCSGADAVAGDIARAIRIAQSGRPGPVHVSLPSDALAGIADPASMPTVADRTPSPVPLDADVADALVGRLRRALRPIILVGPTGSTRRGRALAAALEDATGVPVVGMESPRGTADPSLGAFVEMLAQADYVLLIGKSLDFTVQFGRPPALAPHCTFGEVDADDAELDRSRRAVGERLAIATVADAWSAMRTLAKRAASAGPSHASWRADVQQAIRYRPPEWERAAPAIAERLHPLQALRPLQALLDRHPDAVLVADGGEFGQWARACLTAPHFLTNGMAGSIGSALPYAIGARSAEPAVPVVAVLGDGTFGFHPAEIDTAVRFGLPFVAVIGNDARWNAEHQIQLREYGAERLVGCDLRPTRYDLVAAAFGGYGELVTDRAQMAPAVLRAHQSGLPACLNVMIDGAAAPQIRR